MPRSVPFPNIRIDVDGTPDVVSEKPRDVQTERHQSAARAPSSAISSCSEWTTVTDATLIVGYLTDAASSTTATTTLTTLIDLVSGCGVSATTSTSIVSRAQETTNDYFVFPKNSTSIPEQADVNKSLYRLGLLDSVIIVSSKDLTIGTSFWIIRMTQSQADTVKDLQAVRHRSLRILCIL